MVVLILAFLASGFKTVGSDEQALVLRFGKIRGVGEDFNFFDQAFMAQENCIRVGTADIESDYHGRFQFMTEGVVWEGN